MHFCWKIKLELEHLGVLEIMGETAPLNLSVFQRVLYIKQFSSPMHSPTLLTHLLK